MATDVQRNRLDTDLEHVLAHTESLWDEIRGERIFITGGTGFFGKWLLECLAHANKRMNLQARAVILTRDPAGVKQEVPHLYDCADFEFHRGDVRDFSFPPGTFSHVIHGATTAAQETFRNEPPLSKFETVADGTRRTLEFAAQCNLRKLLLTSTGGAYGPQPDALATITEDHGGAPDLTRPVSSALGEAKRVAELLTRIHSERDGYEAKICRCFTFIGPYLQLDIHYAAGNFIRDALRGGPIVVQGDGSAIRSFLYAADLMIWLWTVLFKGEAGRLYNVGSERAVSVGELAQMVAHQAGVPVKFNNSGHAPATASSSRYVPSVQRIASELGVQELVGLDQAIARTLSFHRTS